MKIAGWIITVFGCISLLGSLIGGNSPIGPIFWIGLGIFLLHRAEQKRKDKEDLDNWSNN